MATLKQVCTNSSDTLCTADNRHISNLGAGKHCLMFFNTSRLQLKLYIFYIQTVQIGQYSKVNEHDSKTKFLDGKQKKLAHQKKDNHDSYGIFVNQTGEIFILRVSLKLKELYGSYSHGMDY